MHCIIVNLHAFFLFFFTSWNLCGHCSSVWYRSEYPLISYAWIIKLAVSIHIVIAIFTITINNSQTVGKNPVELKYYSKSKDTAWKYIYNVFSYLIPIWTSSPKSDYFFLKLKHFTDLNPFVLDHFLSQGQFYIIES